MSIPVNQLLERRVSLFAKCNVSRLLANITIRSYLDAVKNGRYREIVEQVREADKNSKAEADAVKTSKLRVIKPSGTFKGLSEKTLVQHSGILCLDLDNVGAALDETRRLLRADDYVFAFHLSPRGQGLKVFVPISATDAANHKLCVESARAHFAKVLPSGITLDDAPSNVASNCFVSYDPEPWIADSGRSIFEPFSIPSHSTGGGRRGRVISEVSIVSMPDRIGKGEIFSSRSDSMPVVRGRGMEESHPQNSISGNSRDYERKIRSEAEKELHGLIPRLARIYRQFLAKRPVIKGERYAFLTKVIPALICVVDYKVILQLLRLHHRKQTGIWRTSLKDHLEQAQVMLDDYYLKYRNSLSPDEQEIYQRLRADRFRAGFRICRDLWNRNKKCGDGFFLSGAELGVRLGVNRDTGREDLLELTAERVIARERIGMAWSKGQKPKATSFRWLLSEEVEESHSLKHNKSKMAPSMRAELVLSTTLITPTGLCPVCWGKRIAAPIGGPTCGCASFQWPDICSEQVNSAVGQVFAELGSASGGW
jgi:hypothetical protein